MVDSINTLGKWMDFLHKMENNYTKEVLALLQKFQGPQQISQPVDLAKGLRTPREFDNEDQRDLVTELTQDWGNRLMEHTNKILWALGHRRNEERSHKRLSQTCLEVSRSLWWRRGPSWEVRHAGISPPGGAFSISPTTVWPNYREGTQPYSLAENWIKGLLNMASFSLSQSLPSGSFHKPLILLHQRADRLKTIITEN